MLAINVKLVHLSCPTVTAWRNLLNNKKIMTSHSHSYHHYIVFFSSLWCFIMQMERCSCTLQHPASYKKKKEEEKQSRYIQMQLFKQLHNYQQTHKLFLGYCMDIKTFSPSGCFTLTWSLLLQASPRFPSDPCFSLSSNVPGFAKAFLHKGPCVFE